MSDVMGSVVPARSRPQPRPRPVSAAPQNAPGAPVDHTPSQARLPVSELLYDRAGAASPFGDDVTFPLPAGALTYRHPR